MKFGDFFRQMHGLSWTSGPPWQSYKILQHRKVPNTIRPKFHLARHVTTRHAI